MSTFQRPPRRLRNRLGGDALFAACQLLLPTHLLSRLWLGVSRIRLRWIAQPCIRYFQRHYAIDLSEATQTRPDGYPSLNAFFTRGLRPDARPLPDGPGDIACPVDGTISQIGRVDRGNIMQVKGKYYDVNSLLGHHDQWADLFTSGHFCTLYLAPHNYHRVHIPCDGHLVGMHHIPGRLFSVNPASVRHLEGLFTRNERVITLWETSTGPMAVIMVGAMLVGCVDTTWAGRITPGRHTVQLPDTPVRLRRGAEMGRFNMGSSVILLHSPGAVRWHNALRSGCTVLQGESLGRMFDGPGRNS